MLRGEHLTHAGLRQILAIRASMNRGLSEKLKLAFPSVVPVVRPLVENSQAIDPHWLAGFTSGEGSFMIKIPKSSTHSLGQWVSLVFVITQHQRDQQLLFCIVKNLGCGKVYKKGEVLDYRVSKLSDITEKIIPFFYLPARPEKVLQEGKIPD